MPQPDKGQRGEVLQPVVSQRTCILGAGGSAGAVCVLNFGAGEWGLTKLLVSLCFLAFATILPLSFPRWYTKIPIFLHIFRHIRKRAKMKMKYFHLCL